MIDPDAEIFSKYAYLWDGSDPGWTVDGHIEDRAHVRILLPENGIDARFLNALRRTFRNSPTMRRPRSAPGLKRLAASIAARWTARTLTLCVGSASLPDFDSTRRIAR